MRVPRLAYVLILAASACSSGSNEQTPSMPKATPASVAPPSPAGASSGGMHVQPDAASEAPTVMQALPGADAATPAPMPGDAGATSGAAAESGSDSDWKWTPSGLPDVEFSMAVNIPAGQELFKCEYFAVPADRGVIAVPAVESHYAPGSHHLIAYRTSLTSIPADQAGIFDCYGGGLGVFDQRGSYYEAQQPDSHRELPAGVAHEFQPGEVILLESHYVNTTEKDIAGQVTFTMHTVDLASVEHEAGTIMFSDTNIQLPAHSKTRVTMTCPIPEDFNPALLWSHMHHWAVHFVATTDDSAAAAALGTLYDQTDWSEPQPRAYPADPPVTLHAGSHITFSCDYDNVEDTPLMFGVSAQKNEMCLLHGMYWPRMTTPGAEQCRGGTTTITPL